MFLIAGLGNPGGKYEKTKHNMGFDVIDTLVDRYGIRCGGTSMKAMYGKGVIEGEKVILIKPLTYMNLSGEAVAAYVNYYKLNPAEQLLVVYDDIDLEPGSIRVRKKGSAGSHNGMKNIVAQLGTNEFPRIRVGIGAKPEKWDLADYVLAPFSRADREKVDEGIDLAADAAALVVQGEIDRAMNLYNRKSRAQETD